jgi:23S rRNA (cytosine1962-C5)-methyltransferase
MVQFFSKELFRYREVIFSLVIESITEKYKSVKGIVFKDRTQNAGENPQDARKSISVWGGMPPDRYTVLQNNMVLVVDILHGQSTGVFLDMREMRERLLPFYDNCRSLLNLFSYTGAFSIHALSNGVSRAVNIDLSKTVLKRAVNNYLLNGLECDGRDFIAGDVGDVLKFLRKKEQRFDMAVYDPPTFSRNGKKVFNVRRDYGKHLEMLSEIVKGGYVLTSVNAASISKREYRSYHPDGWVPVVWGNESKDFPFVGEPYLKVALWKVP